ncbi:VOC family protein [Salinicoccus albus]|uniref:VOC family protein n=1 Tax=Salinicoccus albus TaxID=418756 RepID=UPI00035D739C|nr:VOC family protein [Salinicoccus albus]
MIKGHHHISMFTKDLKEINQFYTEILGLRRVKISVNQSDPGMYHVFYGDTTGTAGNDLTFFEIPNIGSTHKGTNAITAIGLLVPGRDSLIYWQHRVADLGTDVSEIFDYAGTEAIEFQDIEGLKLVLINHGSRAIRENWEPWAGNDVDPAHMILGMGTVELSVHEKAETVNLLTELFGYSSVYDNGTETLLQSVAGEVFGEILVKEIKGNQERPGKGSIHHIAIQSKEKPLEEWDSLIKERGFLTTGIKRRYYFDSLYFRDDNGIMFEITGPDARGFTADSSIEDLGTTLDLPPFLEDRRAEIESRLRPIEAWT